MSSIRIRRDGPHCELTLARPKVNAIDEDLMADFADAFDDACTDPEIRGILVRAEGTCFSAGLDLRVLPELDRAGIERFLDALDRMISSIFRCPKPVAAAVNGHAIAGGLVIALAADHVALVDSEARVGLTELAVGIPFPTAAFEVIRDAVPPRTLRRLVYVADVFETARAFELGIGDALDPDPDTRARVWLDRAAALPADAYAITKAHLRRDAWRRIDEGTAENRIELVEVLDRPDTRATLARAIRR